MAGKVRPWRLMIAVAVLLGGAMLLWLSVGLRSIPSDAMAPTVISGDRVLLWKFAYISGGPPKPGDIVVFHHPHNPRDMIKRVIALPGDRVRMKAGRLWINGEMVARTQVRQVTYTSSDGVAPLVFTATEYREQLPGETGSHLIHEFSDADRLDETPEFVVPAGRFFAMGDNRDNSEDSRAPSGHRDLAAQQDAYERTHRDDPPGDTPRWTSVAGYALGDEAIGFVPIRSIIGKAVMVAFSFAACEPAQGAECLPSHPMTGL